MQKEGKYKLVCVFNDDKEYSHILQSGSLEDIDNYIYERNIKNSDDLYNKMMDSFWRGTGKYELKIVYNYKGEQQKPILYYEDIEKFKNNNIKVVKEILDEYFSDKRFQEKFLETYVKPLLDIKKDNKIKTYATNLYENKTDEMDFKKFFYAYVSDKKNSNNEEISLNYTKLRNVYSILKFLRIEYTNPIIEDVALDKETGKAM